MDERSLIVGLGNPGTQYEMTRHNLGFKVVQGFAEKQGWAFKRESRFEGKIAQGAFANRTLFLLLPSTYMNLSGTSVRKVVDYYQIPFHAEKGMLAVVDDVYLKLGSMRLREKGSAGGHNGLKSIQHHLQSQGYARLRLGVGPDNPEDMPDGINKSLEEFVLGVFTKKERELLPQVVNHAILVIECWLENGLAAAMQKAGELKANHCEET